MRTERDMRTEIEKFFTETDDTTKPLVEQGTPPKKALVEETVDGTPSWAFGGCV